VFASDCETWHVLRFGSVVGMILAAVAFAGCGGGSRVQVAAMIRCVRSAALGPAKSIPDRRAVGTIYGITPTADIIARPTDGTRVDLFADATDARRAFEYAKARAAEQQAGNAVAVIGFMNARQLARLDRCVFGAGVRPVATRYRLY
jgi:hypothetical protein